MGHNGGIWGTIWGYGAQQGDMGHDTGLWDTIRCYGAQWEGYGYNGKRYGVMGHNRGIWGAMGGVSGWGQGQEGGQPFGGLPAPAPHIHGGGVGRMFALLGAALTREVLRFDVPETVPVIEPIWGADPQSECGADPQRECGADPQSECGADEPRAAPRTPCPHIHPISPTYPFRSSPISAP